MAPNSWLSLVLAPSIRAALQGYIEHVQVASPVPLAAMSVADMHMTLVFFGPTLRGLTPSKHAELDTLLHIFSEDVASSGTSTLEFEALELFPPSKRNLLIAKYHIKDAYLDPLRKLQVACFELGLVSKEEHTTSQTTDFIAHITLGKFKGMKSAQISSVNKAVGNVNSLVDEKAREALSLPFESACLCGG
jgi:2'-5' RNA ligase